MAVSGDSALSADFALKLILLFIAAAALLAIARRASGRGEQSVQQFPSAPPAIPGVISAPARLPDGAEAPSHFGPFTSEPNLGPVRLLNLNFATFEAATGPADSESFADELFVQLYNADTGHKWTQSYFVASPKGLERLLKDKGWDSVFAHDVFFRHYDLSDIRRTLLEHIAEEQKLVRLEEPPADEG